MITITKEFTWDMAHMLADHKGLCINIHGHTYKMTVTAARYNTILDDMDMVVDFKQLKEVVNQVVVAPLDHAFMYWAQTTDVVEYEIANILKSNGRKTYAFPYKPTAERMAEYFIEKLNKYLKQHTYPFRISVLRLWETPSSFAEVIR